MNVLCSSTCVNFNLFHLHLVNSGDSLLNPKHYMDMFCFLFHCPILHPRTLKSIYLSLLKSLKVGDIYEWCVLKWPSTNSMTSLPCEEISPQFSWFYPLRETIHQFVKSWRLLDFRNFTTIVHHLSHKYYI